jgi:hypothetical protein
MPQCKLDHLSDIFGTPDKLLIAKCVMSDQVRSQTILAWFLTARPITLTIIRLYLKDQGPPLGLFGHEDHHTNRIVRSVRA